MTVVDEMNEAGVKELESLRTEIIQLLDHSKTFIDKYPTLDTRRCFKKRIELLTVTRKSPQNRNPETQEQKLRRRERQNKSYADKKRKLKDSKEESDLQLVPDP